MPAYFIALLQVPDVDRYRRDYGRHVLAQLGAEGAELLVASPGPTGIEGEWPATWTVVIRFQDREAALRWYQSESYAPLKRLRIEELSTGGAMALFDGYQPVVPAP